MRRENDVNMYPGEYHVTPLDDQQIQEAAQQRRLRIARTGPGEVDYDRRAHLPSWVYLPFGAGLAATISGILYVVFSLAGISGVIGLLSIAAVVGGMLALSAIAAKPDPKL